MALFWPPFHGILQKGKGWSVSAIRWEGYLVWIYFNTFKTDSMFFGGFASQTWLRVVAVAWCCGWNNHPRRNVVLLFDFFVDKSSMGVKTLYYAIYLYINSWLYYYGLVCFLLFFLV